MTLREDGQDEQEGRDVQGCKRRVHVSPERAPVEEDEKKNFDKIIPKHIT